MKYNVGDRVRIVEKWNAHTCESRFGGMDKWLGKVMTVRSVDHAGGFYTTEEDQRDLRYIAGGWKWNEACIAGLADERANKQKIVITTDGKETLARLYNGKNVVESATAKCHPDDTFDFKEGAKIAMERLMGEDKPAEQKKPETNGEKIANIKNWRVVHRKPVAGDYIRVVKPSFTFDNKGDILKIDGIDERDGMPYVLNKNHKNDTGMSGMLDYKWWYDLECGRYELVEPVCEPDKVEESKPTYYNGKVKCVKSGYSWWTVGKVYDVVDGKITADDGQVFPKRGEPYVDADDVKHAGCESLNHNPRHNPANKFIPYAEEPPSPEKPAEKKYAFNVGDRVKHRQLGNGIVICISYDGEFGVEFDKGCGHNCGGITLVAGTVGTKGTSRWCKEKELKLISEKSEIVGKAKKRRGEFVPHLFWKVTKANFGTIGTPTNYKDAIGRPLCVGDTVELYDEKLKFYGEYPVSQYDEMAFIISIKGSCDDREGTTGDWKIIKKRSFEEVNDGEKVDDIEYVKTERKP